MRLDSMRWQLVCNRLHAAIWLNQTRSKGRNTCRKRNGDARRGYRRCAGAVTTAASAADFDWKKFQGKTITFLANNNPVAQALLTNKDDFEKLTGMTLKVDGYQEQQMRQRLVTVMNARSDEVDVFMTLPSREGPAIRRRGLVCRSRGAGKERGGKGL